MNRLARLVFGYEPEDVEGLHARDVFVEED
jgi:hypothetical protein